MGLQVVMNLGRFNVVLPTSQNAQVEHALPLCPRIGSWAVPQSRGRQQPDKVEMWDRSL